MTESLALEITVTSQLIVLDKGECVRLHGGAGFPREIVPFCGRGSPKRKERGVSTLLSSMWAKQLHLFISGTLALNAHARSHTHTRTHTHPCGFCVLKACLHETI